MALIACPECEATISDKAPACPHCGAPAAVESKMLIAAPTQTVILMPKIHVFIGDREVAVLGRGELATVPIDQDCEVEFATPLRSVSISVRAGEVTRVQLAWNRLSGALVAQQVEAITSGSSMI